MIDGDPRAKLLIVGMAPGRQELQQGRPFVGGSGKLLWGKLAKSNIQRPDCYVVNTIGEWPEGKDGNPTKEQYSKYWEEFDGAVRSFTGRVVLVLGGAALWRVAGLSGIEGWRGYLISPDECLRITRHVTVQGFYKNNSKLHRKGDPRELRKRESLDVPTPPNVEWIIPTLHPAAVMRTGYATVPAFSVDVDRAARAVHGQLNIRDETFIDAPVVVRAHNRDPIAFDIETVPEHEVITDISLSGSLRTMSAPWNTASRAVAVGELGTDLGVKVAHNISFDLPRLEAAGVRVDGPIYDTMLAAQLLQPDLYKGLNPVASLYLDTRRWKHLSDTDPRKYSALDAKRTLELYAATREALIETGQLELFEQSIMPAVRTLIRMTQRGIRVDMEFREKWLEGLRAQEQDALREWNILAPGVNAFSPAQVKRHLYGTMGLVPEFGKLGTVTSDEAALRSLRDKYPDHNKVFTTLLDLREAAKLRGTYAERAIGRDGCIHPSYLPGAKDVDAYGKGMAGTGRITAKDPNIQNQPPSARFLYVPHNPDNILVEADYSQIEARIIAALAGDKRLMQACEDGIHETNMRLLGVDKTRAKNGFYGWCYGAGAKTLRRTFKQHGFDISMRDCEALLDGFNTAYPDTFVWRQMITTKVQTERMLENPFGRRRYFYSGDVPAALDFFPQSCAADIMWAILPELDEVVSAAGGQLLTVVHDSVLLEMPPTFDVSCVRGVMSREFPQIAPGFRVPIKMKFGRNWGAME